MHPVPPRPRPLPGFEGIDFISLPEAEAAGAGPICRLPYSLRVLVEHLLRQGYDNPQILEKVRAITSPAANGHSISFLPGRILLQDASGLPVLADLVALQDAVRAAGGDVKQVLPRLPMDLVVDHAVEVDYWGNAQAQERNLTRERERNAERYRFLRWSRSRLPDLRVVPPGVGICHQLNLEVLADVVVLSDADDGRQLAAFDSVLGTDSHTTMINALSVLGWGVGGIEATAAALGESIVMTVPQVVGVRLTGSLQAGVLATDAALSLTALLRDHGVVQKIVEFCGPALEQLPVPDRATIANMAPEYGATMAFFPADERTLSYLHATGRAPEQVSLVRAFLQAQGMLWHREGAEPAFDDLIEFDLSSVQPTVCGPQRPNQKLTLSQLAASVPKQTTSTDRGALQQGAVVLAAITSCTNTSNPRALITAGLLARKAAELGLAPPPWTKTSLAPGSLIASDLLKASGLQDALDQLGFHVVGHGCTTCMGNSGPLTSAVDDAIREQDLSVAAVVSGNRNFEGRLHPRVRLGYLASPPLVVALALAGTVTVDLSTEPLAHTADGQAVRLTDLWPTESEIDRTIASVDVRKLALHRQLLTAAWDHTDAEETAPAVYTWESEDGFVRQPPFLTSDFIAPLVDTDIRAARPLLILGDGITTDHISPVSRIEADSPAGRWLLERGVPARRLASYAARRLNHDVMLRGAFSNPRLQNQLLPGTEGGMTRLLPEDAEVPVQVAAARYAESGTPVVIVAGHGYGAGSARDWAAKATRMLGVRAVIAKSFERIHRTNLVAMGVLPLQLPSGVHLTLEGDETLDLIGLESALQLGGSATMHVVRDGRTMACIPLNSGVATHAETAWLRHGGLLPKILADARAA